MRNDAIKRHLRTSRGLQTSLLGKIVAKKLCVGKEMFVSPLLSAETLYCLYTSIIRLFMMSNMKYGSLTSKDGCIISLTPGDIENNHFARFYTNFVERRNLKIILPTKNMHLKFHALTPSLVEIISLTGFLKDLHSVAVVVT